MKKVTVCFSCPWARIVMHEYDNGITGYTTAECRCPHRTSRGCTCVQFTKKEATA